MSPRGWPFGEYPRGGTQRLGPHVTSFYGRAPALSNSAIVRGAEATLIFDANVRREAGALRAALDAEPGPPVRELILSHGHQDHTAGVRHFAPPARVFAREFTRDDLAERAGEALAVSDTIVEEPERRDLGGGVVVELRPEPEAHTRGDLWAFVWPDRVALCGDLWFNVCEPYLGSGSARGQIEAIAHLRESWARLYLPGHGPAGMIGPPGEDPVERFAAWLLQEVAALEGLAGGALAAEVRRRFDAQAEVRFEVSLPGFLEASVQAAARDLRRH